MKANSMSESYPYLALARKHGADYGLVLTYDDLLVGRVAAWEIAGQRAVDNLPETERLRSWRL